MRAGMILADVTPAMDSEAAKLREKFKLAEKYEPQQVDFTGYEAGTIVIDPANHFLYLIESTSSARRYGVGVGRAGLTFKGSATIERKAKWPSWRQDSLYLPVAR